MQLQFNKQMLHLQVICGVLETFKPTKEIKEVYAELNKLKEQTERFQNEILYPKLQKIEKTVNNINKKQEERAGSPKKGEEGETEGK